MIRVLVADDSMVVRELLAHILGTDPEVHVVGTASSGEEALRAAESRRPDVITMDLHMPGMDGLEATRRIMETYPVPIVIVTGSSSALEVEMAFRALEAGALTVVQKPSGPSHPDHAAMAAGLVQTVKLMAEVKVVRRWPRPRKKEAASGSIASPPLAWTLPRGGIELVAMGASTGGPLVLQTILSRLPKDLPVPVFVVQHMAPGFIQGFAEWMAETCDLPVQVAAQAERALPGHVYIAPDGFQMKVEAGATIGLTRDAAENGLRPSVSYLFRSVADVYGPRAAGVLLTGMGKDGARELKRMKDNGAVTLVQDKQSSVVPGMPGEAIDLGAATYVLTPGQIAAALSSLVSNHAGPGRASPGDGRGRES